ncbi:MAG: hypothetical protein K2H76_03840 [Muribaculaceae bacterium]|nr:hypothetical protein [Muribaculaceae bacterium]
MKRISRFRIKYYLRWFLWLAWALGWPVLLVMVSFHLLVLFLLVSVWIIGGWFGFFLWGPGMILCGILTVRSGREKRRFKELNDRFSSQPSDGDSDDWDDDDDDWDDDDRDDDDGYEYDTVCQPEAEELDMLYGHIVNEGGKGGRDYRVVPWDVRRWSPPYTAADGIVTLHESSCGVSLDSVHPYDPCFGQPNMWADDPLFAPDPIYLDGFTPYPEDEDDEYEDEEYFNKYYDRHIRWIEAMKGECTYNGNGPGGDDTYSSPFLWKNIPLDELKIFAGTETFNYQVSQYIDWEDFRLNFPGLETWECD